jgi:flavin reductase (DIM6/NTAB) family NADH-FMN oxidoreductase RutF
MAPEWTHHIAYSPSLIAGNLRGNDATAENIIESKEFGVNIAAEDHNVP